jgi:hypothetical protein
VSRRCRVDSLPLTSSNNADTSSLGSFSLSASLLSPLASAAAGLLALSNRTKIILAARPQLLLEQSPLVDIGKELVHFIVLQREMAQLVSRKRCKTK